MTWGTCRYVADFSEGHNKHLNEDGICEPCAALLVKIADRIAAGLMFRADDSAVIVGRILEEPRPVNAQAECAACGERFNGLAQQRPVRGTDGAWRFVHAGRCSTLLRSA